MKTARRSAPAGSGAVRRATPCRGTRRAHSIRRSRPLEGLARRDGQRILLQRDLITTLRQQELGAVGERLAAETGLRHVKATAGDQVAGTYRRQLVPWAKDIERKLGQHVTGVATDGGGIEGGLGRKRDLGLGL